MLSVCLQLVQIFWVRLENATGTGLLLAVGIILRTYEQIQKEQAMEMHPVREFFGLNETSGRLTGLVNSSRSYTKGVKGRHVKPRRWGQSTCAMKDLIGET